jgi:hypothetical protein
MNTTNWFYVFLGVAIVAIFGVLWATIGGAAMAILFAAVFWLASVVLAYALGRGHEAEAMKRGAEVALRAQVSDDRRDMAQMGAIVRIIKEVGPLVRQMDRGSTGQADYPALMPPPPGAFTEGDFRIAGLDEDVEQ